MADIAESLRRFMAPLARRVRLMVGRGVLALVDDSRRMQEIQCRLLAEEVQNRVEHWQPYGFSFHPHPGAEVLLVFPGGTRSHGAAVSVADRRYRVRNLVQGEVALYTDEDGDAGLHRILLKRGMEIHLLAGSSSIVMRPDGITITTPNLDIIKA